MTSASAADDYRFLEEAERAARKSKVGSTLGQVAIARGLFAVAKAIEALAKPPIQVVMHEDKVTIPPTPAEPSIVPDAVTYCAHGNIPGECPVGCIRRPPGDDRCAATLPVGGVRYRCEEGRGRYNHSTDTATGSLIHKAKRKSPLRGRITWTTG